MRTKRALVLGLVHALIGLAVFAVSHVHGVSDPNTPHAFGDHFVLAQAQAGFITVGQLVVLFAVVVLGRAALDRCPGPLQRLVCPYISRAPPPFTDS